MDNAGTQLNPRLAASGELAITSGSSPGEGGNEVAYHVETNLTNYLEIEMVKTFEMTYARTPGMKIERLKDHDRLGRRNGRAAVIVQ